MSTIEVVKADLESGNFRLSFHARQRMSERNVTVRDIQICAEDSEIIFDGNEFKLVELDSTNEDLTIICAYRNGTLIVTVK